MKEKTDDWFDSVTSNQFILSGGFGAVVWGVLYMYKFVQLERWFGESTVFLFIDACLMGAVPILAAAISLKYLPRKFCVIIGAIGWVLLFGFLLAYCWLL